MCKGSVKDVRYLITNSDVESKGKKIKNSVLIYKHLICCTNKNSAWLFQRHKDSPSSNTIILIKVTAVTRVKHSEQDTEQACSVICTLHER